MRTKREGDPRRRGGDEVRSKHRSSVVVRPRILGVRILGEDDELARIVGPVAQGVKVERAPNRLRRRGRLHAREGVAVAYTPPALHIDLHRSRRVRGDVTVDRNSALAPAPTAATRPRAGDKLQIAYDAPE